MQFYRNNPEEQPIKFDYYHNSPVFIGNNKNFNKLAPDGFPKCEICACTRMVNRSRCGCVEFEED
jgi:hypothetical protein